MVKSQKKSCPKKLRISWGKKINKRKLKKKKWNAQKDRILKYVKCQLEEKKKKNGMLKKTEF